jgi:hypothetical protein
MSSVVYLYLLVSCGVTDGLIYIAYLTLLRSTEVGNYSSEVQQYPQNDIKRPIKTLHLNKLHANFKNYE